MSKNIYFLNINITTIYTLNIQPLQNLHTTLFFFNSTVVHLKNILQKKKTNTLKEYKKIMESFTKKKNIFYHYFISTTLSLMKIYFFVSLI